MSKPKQPIRPDSAPPFHKWCERDFLADTVVMHPVARMMYRSLLQAAFSTASTRPNLPNNSEQLRRLLGGVSAELWTEHSDEIVSMFTPSPDGTLLTHKRLQEDFEKLQDYRHSQSQSKAKYWDKVRTERLQASNKLATTDVQPGLYQEDVDVDVDVENETEKEGENEIDTPLSPPSSSIPSERARELADYCVEIAKSRDTRVIFFPKSLLNIARIIEKLNATPEELAAVVREAVQPMTDRDVGFCGSIIEGVLAGSIAERRKATVQAKKNADAMSLPVAAVDDMFGASKEPEYLGNPETI